MAYKRELIINNGSLTSYKKLLKVSDVCQLLDKSKYPATQTINGVTFTNNGDGTITANGTATANSTFNLLYKVDLLTVVGHKYLLIGCPKGGNASSTYFLRYDSDGGTTAYDMGNGVIFTKTNEKIAYINIRVFAGYTANNIVFKPQLFDLTEMYGAGNEPKTVAEFKTKFPNELYPYSPRCWVKSYKTGLIAKTKNLFDNIIPGNNCRVLFSTSRAIATQVTADTDTSGLFKIVSYNGSSYEVISWIRDVFTLGRITNTFTTPEITGYKTIIFGLNGAKIDTTCQCEINLKPSTIYTFSCNFTNITQGSISWTDMQLEEGSTATDYVPYGYL